MSLYSADAILVGCTWQRLSASDPERLSSIIVPMMHYRNIQEHHVQSSPINSYCSNSCDCQFPSRMHSHCSRHWWLGVPPCFCFSMFSLWTFPPGQKGLGWATSNKTADRQSTCRHFLKSQSRPRNCDEQCIVYQWPTNRTQRVTGNWFVQDASMRHCQLLPLLRLGLFMSEWSTNTIGKTPCSSKASARIFGKLYSATRKTLDRVFYESKSTNPCPRCSYCIGFAKSGF